MKHNILHPLAILALSYVDDVAAVPIVQKTYTCNDETGFCELQPLGTESGSPQNVCLLTCKGTIWPAPKEIEIFHETTTFCDVAFSGFPASNIMSAALDNFLLSIGLKDGCNDPSKKLNIVLDISVRLSFRIAHHIRSVLCDVLYSIRWTSLLSITT